MLGEEFQVGDEVQILSVEEVVQELYHRPYDPDIDKLPILGYDAHRAEMAGRIFTINEKENCYLERSCHPDGSSYRYDFNEDYVWYRDYQLRRVQDSKDTKDAWLSALSVYQEA